MTDELLTSNTVTLPSKGALYGGKIPNGVLTVKRLTAYDQQILFGGGSLEEKLSKLLQHTVNLPQGFKADQLLTIDRMALLLAIRSFAFGTQYTFNYACPECGAKQQHTTDIARDLNQVDSPETLSEPFEVRLPDCGKTVSLRFLRGHDETEVAKYAKRVSMQSVDSGDSSALYRLARLIQKVDDVETDIVVREKFVREMSARDANTIEDEISFREPGIDLKVHPECNRCGHVAEMVMPFDREFFRPASSRP